MSSNFRVNKMTRRATDSSLVVERSQGRLRDRSKEATSELRVNKRRSAPDSPRFVIKSPRRMISFCSDRWQKI